MTTPTHDEISRQAQQLWQDRGCPVDCDAAIWYEAERDLRDRPAAEVFSERARGETVAENAVEYHLSPAQTEQKSIVTTTLKKNARAPQVPHHTGPKSKPAESGKPLWDRPHSS